MYSFLLALTLSLPAHMAAPCPSAPVQEQDSLFGDVQSDLEQRVAEGLYQGVVAIVEIEGERLLELSHGVQNLADGKPMAIDSIFRIYSMTKPVTVVAALMLMEQGRFQLDDPVSKFLPRFKGLTVGIERAPLDREMSVRDLMRHTSGLTYGIFANSAVDTLVADADLLNPGSSLEEMVAKLGQLPLKSQPGRNFEYSLSIDVLGRLVEVLAEQSFASYLEEQLFAPLGMQDTAFYVLEKNVPRLADLNTRVGGELEALEEQPSLTQLPRLQSGGGGLFSTAGDYLNFARMLLNGGVHEGKRLLKRQTVELMCSNQMALLGRGGSFGLGGAVVSTDSGTGPGLHTYSWGGLAGTNFWMDPSEGIIGIFMIQNMGEGNHSERFKNGVYDCLGR